MGEMNISEILRIAFPLIVFQLALQIGCVISIVRRGVKNLNKPAWIAIVLLTNILGPIAFLIWGRKGAYDD